MHYRAKSSDPNRATANNTDEMKRTRHICNWACEQDAGMLSAVTTRGTRKDINNLRNHLVTFIHLQCKRPRLTLRHHFSLHALLRIRIIYLAYPFAFRSSTDLVQGRQIQKTNKSLQRVRK